MANLDSFYDSKNVNVNDLYKGIYPSPAPAPVSAPLTSRSVPTVPIDPKTNAPFTTAALQAIRAATLGNNDPRLQPNAYVDPPGSMSQNVNSIYNGALNGFNGNMGLAGISPPNVDPGQTDWSVANQGMDGIMGDPRAGSNRSAPPRGLAAMPAPNPIVGTAQGGRFTYTKDANGNLVNNFGRVTNTGGVGKAQSEMNRQDAARSAFYAGVPKAL